MESLIPGNGFLSHLFILSGRIREFKKMDLMAGFSLSTENEADRSLYTMLEPEGQRYASFFATLEQTAPQLVARATALAFFDKSSLGPAEIEALYTSVKRVGVVADAAVMNETEFVMAMHLIVCLTKRGLAAVPQPFPTYLFPTLALPSTASSSISSMPSPDKPSGLGLSSNGIGDLPGSAAPLDSAPTATAMATLAGSTSLVELTQKEIQNQQVVTTQLARIDQSSATTLQQLHAMLHALAAAVDQMGFPVPPATHASVGAIDDLGNLLRANVQTVKQEIQSLEIAARMRSVADEATSRTNSLSGVGETQAVAPSETSAAIAVVAQLSSQLATLQHKATQLRATKESLVRQLLDKKKTTLSSGPPPAPVSVKTVSSGFPPPPSSSSSTSSMGMAASAGWGDFGGTSPAAVAPLASPQETTRSTEVVPPPLSSSADAFGFAAFPATESTGATPSSKPQDADFGWGAFE